jgi:hypothetical protein
MILEIYEDYLLFFVLGIGIGALVTWMYFRSRLKKRNLAEVIDAAMIEKNINQLDGLTTYLNQVTALLKTSSEELSDRIRVTQDIEQNIAAESTPVLNLDELNLEKEIEVLEKNK